MIRTIDLANVRIFEGDGWKFELKPLTVFCGTNSAGKSTLLKAMLLLRQSQDQNTSGQLCLAGPRVDFGDYRSFVSHEDVKRKVGMALTVDVALTPSAIEFLRSLGRSKKRSKQAAVATTEFAELRASFTFFLPSQSDDDAGKLPPDSATEPRGVFGFLDRASFHLYVDGKEVLEWRIARSLNRDEGSGPYHILLPVSFFKKSGGFRLMAVTQADEWVRENAILNGLLPQGMIAKPRNSKGSKSDSRAEASAAEQFISYPLPPIMQRALWAFEEALSNVHYLGPLRAPAKRYYVANLGVDPDMDPTGEFLPYVLRDHAEDRVINVLPGLKGEAVRQSLKEALDAWMGYLRTGEKLVHGSQRELILNTTKQILVQISLKSLSGKETHALADSGFGYSQVLPILVRGLLVDTGGTFIVEQPELHLNPSLQVRLAEFFVSMVHAGKQVLIETHSEHIVNAIRVLTAEDETGSLAERSRIYFLEASATRPVLHELSMQKDGTIPEWPRHFFGEAVELTGRLLRAQKRFRDLTGSSK